jgi:hypothetical protein
MSKLDRMNGHDPAMTKVALPLLVGVLVVDSVLYVIREQVFQLYRCVKPQAYFGRLPPSHRSIASVDVEQGRISP